MGSARPMAPRRRVVTAVRVLTLLVGLLVWWLYAGSGSVSNLILPKPTLVARELWDLLGSGVLWHAAGTTLVEVVLAAALSLVGGVGIGFAVSRSARWTRVVEPVFAWAFMAPLILLYPVFLLWFGIGIWSKVGYATASALIPIAYNCMKAFRQIDERYLTVARAYGATRAQTDWLVKLPAAMPLVVAGVRIGIAVTLITVVVAEMLGSQRGLGYLIAQSSQTLQVPYEYAVTVLVVVLVVVIQRVITTLTSLVPGGGDD